MEEKGKFIDRNNYEIWLLDFVDGQLTNEEERLLMQFLENNPPLKKELEGIIDLKLLSSNDIEFSEKAKLKRAAPPFSDLSLYNYLMVGDAENDLNEYEQLQLKRIIDNSPKALNDLNLFRKLKLQPEAIVFTGKKSLRRVSIHIKGISWLKVAVAAAMIIVLFNYRQHIPKQTEWMHPDIAMIDSNNLSWPLEETQIEVLDNEILNVVHLKENVKLTEIELLTRNETDLEIQKENLTNKLLIENELLPRPKPDLLVVKSMPNSYEEGLRIMLPMYFDNCRRIEELNDLNLVRNEEKKGLLEQAALLISKLTPFNLKYEKIYDEEGELVAINLAGDNFELHHKLLRRQNIK